MTVLRAKFRCTSVKQIKTCSPDGKFGDPQEEVTFSAVYGGDNTSWSKWTPCGSLTMTINNSKAQGVLKPGQCYYLDLSEAPEKDPE